LVDAMAPSGEQYEIGGDGYRAVVTECGAGLRVLEHEGRSLVAGYAEDQPASAGRGQLLAPWPNRIRDGAYTFGDRHLQLPLSEPSRGNASHGLVRWAAWTLSERSERSVSQAYRLMSQTGYPWTLDLQVEHVVSAEGLTVTVTATNLGADPAPYALGSHPYLLAGDGPVDGWELALAADSFLLTDDRMIPTGRADVRGTDLDFAEPRPIGPVVLDTAFTGLTRDADERVEVVLRDPSSGGGVALWMDRTHSWVQLFTGDTLPADEAREALAVEPMTAPPNAFASGEDLVVLSRAGTPGARHVATWGIRAL
jgi:aldose 1-epimerase